MDQGDGLEDPARPEFADEFLGKAWHLILAIGRVYKYPPVPLSVPTPTTRPGGGFLCPNFEGTNCLLPE